MEMLDRDSASKFPDPAAGGRAIWRCRDAWEWRRLHRGPRLGGSARI